MGTAVAREWTQFELPSWSEGIGPFHGEACLTDLRRVGWGNAGELRPYVIDDVEIAVRAVVVPQANIGADCLCVRGIKLNQTREGQKASKGVVSLQTCQHYREITVGQGQSKSIPSLGSRNRELRSGPIIG